MSEATDAYRRLRDRADRRGSRLTVLHDADLACRPGCHDCCTELSVSPVEYAVILEDLRGSGTGEGEGVPPAEPGAACSFLSGGLCGIYRVRPLICRTHGLPVAFRDGDDGSSADVSVSFCPKNFLGTLSAVPDFGPANTLDLDALNADLASANRQFAREQSDAACPTGPGRVPLKRLRHDLGPRTRREPGTGRADAPARNADIGG